MTLEHLAFGTATGRCGRCLPCRRRATLRGWWATLRGWGQRWADSPVLPVALCTLVIAGVLNWFVIVLGEVL